MKKPFYIKLTIVHAYMNGYVFYPINSTIMSITTNMKISKGQNIFNKKYYACIGFRHPAYTIPFENDEDFMNCYNSQNNKEFSIIKGKFIKFVTGQISYILLMNKVYV